MSRVIKFRAYEVEHNKMHILDLYQGASYDQDFILRNKEANDRESWIDDHCSNVVWPVMQFTGLKDRHGVDIYEGDILQHFEDEDENEPYDWTYLVVWANAYSGFQWCEQDKEGKIEFYGGIGDSELIKVIGNIYQNPDLLK